MLKRHKDQFPSRANPYPYKRTLSSRILPWVGVLLMLLGIVVGLYLGVWVLFIGGLADGLRILFVGPFNAFWLAVDVLRVLSAAFVGWGSFVLLFATGYSML